MGAIISHGGTSSATASPTSHNSLSGIQGGAAGDYQHLTAAELAKVQEGKVKFTGVSVATYTITLSQLIEGTNIFGVTYAGAVTIKLPLLANPLNVVYINRETGTGVITITGV